MLNHEPLDTAGATTWRSSCTKAASFEGSARRLSSVTAASSTTSGPTFGHFNTCISPTGGHMTGPAVTPTTEW